MKGKERGMNGGGGGREREREKERERERERERPLTGCMMLHSLSNTNIGVMRSTSLNLSSISTQEAMKAWRSSSVPEVRSSNISSSKPWLSSTRLVLWTTSLEGGDGGREEEREGEREGERGGKERGKGGRGGEREEEGRGGREAMGGERGREGGERREGGEGREGGRGEREEGRERRWEAGWKRE